MSTHDEVWDDFERMTLKEQLDAIDEEREVDWLVEYAEARSSSKAPVWPLLPHNFVAYHPRTLAWIEHQVEARRDEAARGDPDAAYEGSKDA